MVTSRLILAPLVLAAAVSAQTFINYSGGKHTSHGLKPRAADRLLFCMMDSVHAPFQWWDSASGGGNQDKARSRYCFPLAGQTNQTITNSAVVHCAITQAGLFQRKSKQVQLIKLLRSCAIIDKIRFSKDIADAEPYWGGLYAFNISQ